MPTQHKADRASGYVFLRKGKRGDRWYAHYRANGKRQKKLLGPAWTGKGRPQAGFYTERLAKEALQAILTDARRGELAVADPVGTAHTYGDACEAFLSYREASGKTGDATLRDYRNAITKHLLPGLGADTPVGTVTTEDIDTLVEKLLAEGKLSRRTIQKLSILNYGILKRAKQRKWTTANAAEDAERITLTRSGDFNVLTPAEVLAVARHADDEQDAALFTVAAFTGLRMGELRALRWRDVDFAGQSVLVRRNRPAHGGEKAPKSGKVRSVPLIDQAGAALDKLSRRSFYTEAGDLVFVAPNGSYLDDGEMRRTFYAALKRAGLGHKRYETPALRFHDLRHTFGTLGAQVWPLRDLQAYMGHASIQTTEIYAHHVPKTNAANALTALVSGADSGAPLVPGSNGHQVPSSEKASA